MATPASFDDLLDRFQRAQEQFKQTICADVCRQADEWFSPLMEELKSVCTKKKTAVVMVDSATQVGPEDFVDFPQGLPPMEWIRKTRRMSSGDEFPPPPAPSLVKSRFIEKSVIDLMDSDQPNLEMLDDVALKNKDLFHGESPIDNQKISYNQLSDSSDIKSNSTTTIATASSESLYILSSDSEPDENSTTFNPTVPNSDETFARELEAAASTVRHHQSTANQLPTIEEESPSPSERRSPKKQKIKSLENLVECHLKEFHARKQMASMKSGLNQESMLLSAAKNTPTKTKKKTKSARDAQLNSNMHYLGPIWTANERPPSPFPAPPVNFNANVQGQPLRWNRPLPTPGFFPPPPSLGPRQLRPMSIPPRVGVPVGLSHPLSGRLTLGQRYPINV